LNRGLAANHLPVILTLVLLTLSVSIAAGAPALPMPVKLQTGAVVAVVKIGHSPNGVAYDSLNGDIYVANHDSNTTSVIDGRTNKVIANVTVGMYPTGIAFDSANGDVYVANYGFPGSVTVIDGSTNKVVATVPVGLGSNPTGVAFDPLNGRVYITCTSFRMVAVIDGSSNSVVANVSLDSYPGGIAADSTNGNVYVTGSTGHMSGTVTIINGSTDKVVSVIPGFLGPQGITYDSYNGDIYVADSFSGNISRIDGSSNKVVANITGAQADELASDTSNGEVYTGYISSQLVLVINGSTNSLVSGFIVEKGASNSLQGIAYDSSNGDLYLSNYVYCLYTCNGNDTVSVIDTRIATRPIVKPVSVTCAPDPDAVGSSTTCKAKVPGNTPTGTITWSSSAPGAFSTHACKLTKGGCFVRYTPANPRSPLTVTASYSGDSKNPPSVGTYALTVVLRHSKTTISCKPGFATAGSSTVMTCKTTVVGYLPTGTVNWSQSGAGSVALTSTSCTLVQLKNHNYATCSVMMTGTTIGKVTLQATYSGDPNNQGSSRTAKLTIRA